MQIDGLYTIEQQCLKQVIDNKATADLAKINSDNPFIAISGLHKALSIASKGNISPAKEQIMLNLAHWYEENDNPDEAVYWYKKCLNERYFADDILYRTAIVANLIINQIQCETLINTGSLLDVSAKIDEIQDTGLKEQLMAVKYYIEARIAFHFKNRHHTDIENLLLKAKTLFKTSGSNSIFTCLDMDVDEILGELYSYTNDLPDSLKHFESAINLAEIYRNKKREAILYGKISSAYEKTGDLKSALEGFKKFYRLSEDICRKRSGQYSDYLLEVYNIEHAEGTISQLKDINKKLTNKRNTDFLTGIYNRRFWDETIRYKVVEQGIEASPASVLMMDVDSFKMYNDHRGHTQGDAILKQIADVLKRCVVRDTDVVARYGGEEFIILLDATGVPGSKKVAAGILDEIRSLGISVDPENPDDILTLSIGISTGTVRSESDIYDLIRGADKALYYSKKCGKGRYTHFNDIPQTGGC